MTLTAQFKKLVVGLLAVSLLASVLVVSFAVFSPHTSYAASVSPAKTITVQITTNKKGVFTFKPKTLNIAVGTTVKWINKTSVQHTATSNDGKTFNSGFINPGASFKFTFTTAGSFPYHCNVHPFMMGTINVS